MTYWEEKFFRLSSQYVHAKLLQPCLILRDPTDCSLPLSMGFSRQEYWSEWPCPPPGDLPHPGIKPESFMSPVLADGFFTTSATLEALYTIPVEYFTYFLINFYCNIVALQCI